jgi:hypothetical protein
MRSTALAEKPATERRTTRFGLTERKQQQYSLARAILASAEPQEGTERNCFELEISQTIEKSVTGKRHGGIFIPWSIAMGANRRELSRRDHEHERRPVVHRCL